MNIWEFEKIQIFQKKPINWVLRTPLPPKLTRFKKKTGYKRVTFFLILPTLKKEVLKATCLKTGP